MIGAIGGMGSKLQIGTGKEGRDRMTCTFLMLWQKGRVHVVEKQGLWTMEPENPQSDVFV